MPDFRKSLLLIFGLGTFFMCSVIFMVGIFGIIWFSAKKQSRPPALIFPTRLPTAESTLPKPGVVLPTSIDDDQPKGKIVFVCQVFKLQSQDQICIMNADGTGWRRLTMTDNVRSFYPSLAPDGKTVVYSSNLDGNFKIYEMDLFGNSKPLGQTIGIAPEISPDGSLLTFANNDGREDVVWIMNRDGSGKRVLYTPGWDPTWSPDGKKVLFATYIGGIPQLAVINLDGSGFLQITNLPFLRGRSDWSPDGQHIITYSGKPWERELYLMSPDGTNMKQISPTGGNSQGPSFSPDGQWVAFTSYYDSIGNNNGCEIYILRIDGTQLRRLTDNSYCDWQPRWGP